MAKAYLIHTTNFGKFMQSIGLNAFGDSYQIYVPEKGMMMGYFTDKEFTLSDNRFCNTELSDYAKEKLDLKVKDKKFIKEFDVDNKELERICISFKELTKAKSTFNGNLVCFTNIYKYLKKV
jgi:hypothetical protein